MNESDKYIGERFEDRDRRSEGRVIRVVRAGLYGYWTVTEVHPTNPKAVGRHTVVSARTLDTRYRKISR